MTLRNFFILALLIGGIAYLQWLMVSPPTPARPARLAEEPWKIPDQLEFDANESLAILDSASLWGKLADTALATPLNDPEWRFLGAMARGQERYVIIKIENQPEQKLVPGDTLPGGSKILSIENDRLCLLVNKQKRSLAIYPQGPLSGKMSNLGEAPAAWAEPAKPGRRRN
jgi:hypothetical protein